MHNNDNSNRPDIIIKNNKEKTCTLIDVAIPADRNVIPQDVEYEMYDYASNNWGYQNSNKGVNKIWKPNQEHIQ